MYTSRLKTINVDDRVTILSGNTESAVIDCIGASLVGINFPSVFEPTALFFKSAESENGTYGFVIDANGELVTAHSTGANARVRLGDILELERYIKIVANTAVPADRELTLIFKRYDKECPCS